MPALGMRGGMAARGFGMFGFMPSTGDFGMFFIGSVTNKYFWANDAVNPGTSFPSGNVTSSGGAVGNSTKSIVARGQGIFGMYKYTYANNAFVTTTNMSPPTNNGVGTSNPNFGLFVIGNGVKTTRTWTFSNDGIANGTDLQRYASSSCKTGQGIAAFAIFSVYTSTGSAFSKFIDKYTYSSGTTAFATDLKVTLTIGAGSIGNADQAIFMVTNETGGRNTQKYTYAGDTTAAGGLLYKARSIIITGCSGAEFGCATANDNVSPNTYLKYVYAGDVSLAGSATTAYSSGASGVSSGLAGVNA